LEFERWLIRSGAAAAGEGELSKVRGNIR
jgi:hypothetical protein